jgi:ATP-binding protein involved in chromosome partitioning
MALTRESVEQALSTVREPEVQKGLVELGMVRDIEIEGDVVRLAIRLLGPVAPFKEALERAIVETVRRAGAASVDVAFTHRTTTRDLQDDDPCPGVANVVLVMSGKGGVGKSTVATNLTMALSREGAKVGLLDADMYGPSVPTMLGVSGRPTSLDGKKFVPLERFGVKLMSLGFLLDDPRQAVIWRGPMLQNALLQFVRDVEWGTLDYLLLDLPPGTGDIAITISQKMRTTGAVVVTTPQEVALQDVYKSVSMTKKVGIQILGVVENESYFICDGCEKKHELFGSGGGRAIAEFAEAPLLGQLPLHPAVREWGDAGTPIVQAAPDAAIAGAFVDVARRLAGRVSVENTSRTPPFVIDRSGGKNRHLPIAR